MNVTNIGNRAGREVVQLYLKDPQSTLIRPEQELKNFTKVELKPGEIKEIIFKLNRRDLYYYDSMRKMWIAESGIFEIRIGASSRDIRLAETFTYKGSDYIPIILDEYLFISTFWKHEKTRAALCEVVPDWLSQFIPEGKSINEAVIDDFLIEHPIVKLPHFTRGEISVEGVLELVESCRSMTFIP